jgi:hypothetical protein
MDLDRILRVFNALRVDYLLIGGMNFLLRHEPVLTYDVDLWIEDTPENLCRAEGALGELEAQWGPTEENWEPVAGRSRGWLSQQSVFCLTSPAGPIDIFRTVCGLESWARCRQRACSGVTAGGAPYVGLSDADMLQCQLALPESQRKLDRIRSLQAAIERASHAS